jgi:hypothetical protein
MCGRRDQAHWPATWRVLPFRRFHTLITEICTIRSASARSASVTYGREMWQMSGLANRRDDCRRLAL